MSCCCSPRTVKVVALEVPTHCPSCLAPTPANEMWAYKRCESCYVGPHINGVPVPVHELGGSIRLAKQPRRRAMRDVAPREVTEEELEIQYA